MITHIPNIYSIPAALEHYDPVHSSLFKVIFSVPLLISGQYDLNELDLISTQIISIEGLDTLQKPISTYTRKYFGVETVGIKPTIDSTIANFTITFNLNLRKVSDNYVFKCFKEWMNIMYDLPMGAHSIKYLYVGEYLNIYQANRDGTIWRQINFKNVFPTNITGLSSLDISSSDAVTLGVSFIAEYWEEVLA